MRRHSSDARPHACCLSWLYQWVGMRIQPCLIIRYLQWFCTRWWDKCFAMDVLSRAQVLLQMCRPAISKGRATTFTQGWLCIRSVKGWAFTDRSIVMIGYVKSSFAKAAQIKWQWAPQKTRVSAIAAHQCIGMAKQQASKRLCLSWLATVIFKGHILRSARSCLCSTLAAHCFPSC